jgi:hypothetical protein
MPRIEIAIMNQHGSLLTSARRAGRTLGETSKAGVLAPNLSDPRLSDPRLSDPRAPAQRPIAGLAPDSSIRHGNASASTDVPHASICAPVIHANPNLAHRNRAHISTARTSFTQVDARAADARTVAEPPPPSRSRHAGRRARDRSVPDRRAPPRVPCYRAMPFDR